MPPHLYVFFSVFVVFLFCFPSAMFLLNVSLVLLPVCRSCIVKHFKKSLFCPECDVQVERGCPLNKLR